MVRRFPHEEQREAANEYWGRREAERFRPYRFDELPPLPPVRTAPPETWDEWVARRDAIRQELNNRTYSLEELGLGHLRK